MHLLQCTIYVYAVNCVKSAFLDTCLLDEDLSLFHPATAPGLGIPLPEEDDELGHAEADVGEAAEADEDQVEALALEAVERHRYIARSFVSSPHLLRMTIPRHRVNPNMCSTNRIS